MEPESLFPLVIRTSPDMTRYISLATVPSLNITSPFLYFLTWQTWSSLYIWLLSISKKNGKLSRYFLRSLSVSSVITFPSSSKKLLFMISSSWSAKALHEGSRRSALLFRQIIINAATLSGTEGSISCKATGSERNIFSYRLNMLSEVKGRFPDNNS